VVRIVGNRLLTSQRLELLVRPERAMTAENVRVHRLRDQDVAHGIHAVQATRQLMDFIGSRTLVGYYLEFDVAMLNPEIWPLLGLRLPQPKIEYQPFTTTTGTVSSPRTCKEAPSICASRR